MAITIASGSNVRMAVHESFVVNTCSHYYTTIVGHGKIKALKGDKLSRLYICWTTYI